MTVSRLSSAHPDLAAAAAAAAAVLPTAEPLVPAAAVSDVLPGPDDATVAVSAELTGAVQGVVAVVVGGELAEVLRTQGLSLAAAMQPALDAAAAALGPVVVAAAVEAPVEDAVAALRQAGPLLAVPLLAGGEVRASLLLSGAAHPAPAIPVGSGTPPRPRPAPGGRRSGLELLRDVEMEVTVELGRTRMPVRELLSLAPGAVVELDRAAGSPADLLVNGTLIARGEVVVVDEDFGLRITEIVVPVEAAS